MSRKKKKNSTTPRGKISHTPGDFSLPIRQELGVAFCNVPGKGTLAHPVSFPTFSDLAKDSNLSVEGFRKAVKGILKYSINVFVLEELGVDIETIYETLKSSKEMIQIIDDLPAEVIATARVFIADGMSLTQAIVASRKI